MGVDRVRSLRKIPTRLRGTNFCTSLTRFVLSIGRQPNSPKCTQIVQKARKQEFRVQWGGWGAFIAKNSNTTLWHELLHQFDPFCIEYYKATKRVPNAPEQYETHQNVSLWSNGADRVLQLRKILMRLRGMNFCTSSVPFCTEFCKATKQPQMHPNSRKQTKT